MYGLLKIFSAAETEATTPKLFLLPFFFLTFPAADFHLATF